MSSSPTETRWSRAAIAAALLGALASLTFNGEGGPLVVVLLWVIGVSLIVTLVGFAWTFPAARGLWYRNRDRMKARRKRRRLRRWNSTVLRSSTPDEDGNLRAALTMSLDSPRNPDHVLPEVTFRLRGRRRLVGVFNWEGAPAESGVTQLFGPYQGVVSFWSSFPAHFPAHEHWLPEGRYKLTWKGDGKRLCRTRFRVDESGSVLSVWWLRLIEWKRGLVEIDRREQEQRAIYGRN